MKECINLIREVWGGLPEEDRWAACITAVAAALLITWINYMI